MAQTLSSSLYFFGRVFTIHHHSIAFLHHSLSLSLSASACMYVWVSCPNFGSKAVKLSKECGGENTKMHKIIFNNEFDFNCHKIQDKVS